MIDYDAISDELNAARRQLIEAHIACSCYVDSRAAQGDELAAALVQMVKIAERRNQTALLEAQISLPVYPNRKGTSP